jgi:thioredoxin-dependent peroxiredoxin
MFQASKIVKLGSISRISLAVWFATGVVLAAEEPVQNDKPVPLEVGDLAPAFEGQNDQGMKWKSSDSVGKKFIVLYFYPADFTTGCTKQAELWRDNMNALADKGVAVVGVSGDSVENHKLFKQAWKLNFPLLADEEGSIAEQFGVPVNHRGGQVRPHGPDRKPLTDDLGNPLVLERKATLARWTFLIGPDGKILYKNTKVNPAQDSQQVMDFLENLKEPKTPSTQPEE